MKFEYGAEIMRHFVRNISNDAIKQHKDTKWFNIQNACHNKAISEKRQLDRISVYMSRLVGSRAIQFSFRISVSANEFDLSFFFRFDQKMSVLRFVFVSYQSVNIVQLHLVLNTVNILVFVLSGSEAKHFVFKNILVQTCCSREYYFEHGLCNLQRKLFCQLCKHNGAN